MRVVVTGGAGFIGSNLVEQVNLVEPGWEVVVVDDLSTGSRANLDGLDAEFREGSVADPAFIDSAFRGAHAIVHLGALGSVPRSIDDPRASHRANIDGTLTVLEAVRGQDIPYLVVASSSSVYGANLTIPKREEDWTRPLSPYAATKLATEAYTYAFAESYQMATLPLRFFNVYGPRQSSHHPYAAVLPKFMESIVSGQPLRVHGDGSQSRDFTYVRTVCAVLIDAVQRRVTERGPVNLAYGRSVSILELLTALEQVTGRALEVEHLASRAGDVFRSQGDGVRVRELFPSVEPIALEDGLAETWDWYERAYG